MDNKIGERFNLVEIIELYKKTNKHKLYICVCDCGNLFIAYYNNLQKGNTKSCGCTRGDSNKTHGMSKTKFYKVWRGMIARCKYPNHISYHNYGGRGIKVCDRWLNSFENFKEDMFNTYSKGLDLDRIDNNKGYSLDNCRWVSREVNCNNTRKVLKFEVNDEILTITQLSEKYNINRVCLAKRLRLGWNVYKAVYTPSKAVNSGINVDGLTDEDIDNMYGEYTAGLKADK